MNRALLVGNEPDKPLGYSYVTGGEYEAVVIGSLTFGQLLHFSDERVLQALAAGKPVTLYTPGLPEAPKNRAFAAALTGARRELKNWGIVFTDGGQKRLITAREAQLMRQMGKSPDVGAVLTPLAKDILEGKQ